MSNRHHHPVAGFQCLADRFPQIVIERTAAHAPQGLVFHRNLVLIEILIGKVAPSPLSVVAITQRTVAHGRVSHQEQHGVIATA